MSGTIATVKPRSSRIRRHGVRAVAATGLAGALLAAGVGAAQANQSYTLTPNTGHSFNTWFFGRTQVCIKNLSSTNDGSYYWVSSTSSDSGGLLPGQETCFVRSFVGFQIYVKNTSARANLGVRFPIGP